MLSNTKDKYLYMLSQITCMTAFLCVGTYVYGLVKIFINK